MNKRCNKVYYKLYYGYSEDTAVLDAESEQLVQE